MLDTTIGFKNGVGFNFLLGMGIVRYTTIRSVVAVKVKKIHRFTPKEMGELTPVPSVVCVLVIKTMRICMFHPVD
jgi:hypothetical protein